MTSAEVLDIARDAIWLTLVISGPVMLVGLIVGGVIALLQALTQVQEQTLVFVPKIIATFLMLLICLPLMGALLGAFTQELFAKIAKF